MDELIQALGDGDLESEDESVRRAAEDKVGRAAAALDGSVPGASSLLKEAQKLGERRGEDRRTGADRRATPKERRTWMDRRDGGDRRREARRAREDRRRDERIPASGEAAPTDESDTAPKAEAPVVFDPQGRPTEVCGIPVSPKMAKLIEIIRREKGHGRN